MTIWPWTRHRALAAAAERRVVDADAELRAAEARKAAAERLAAQSRSVNDGLQREIDKNSWTELLQNAWSGRR